MSTKFFTNREENTLFNKLKGIATEMDSFYGFHAVVGYFRSSGYFKLRKELSKVSKIQILVGINTDKIFKKHNQALLLFGNDKDAKDTYSNDFIRDVKEAAYTPEVEHGILQLCEDLKSGKVEMKIHPTKDLHAKFYLCLPQNYTQNTDGWVIMGSSNISESGLGITQPPHYELNIALKDYDDVSFCKAEFDELWKEGVIITANDMENMRKQTHVKTQDELPTPYELYMKVLIDSFGEQVEDDFRVQLPDGMRDLKYQKDAVIQGYRMLLRHNGFFLADVVGLGKTIVAAMITQRFIETNGRYTNILVIYPPALEQNWKRTFKQFSIDKKTQFVSNGSLSKVLEGKANYREPEEFDLIIVDEAHNFRTDSTNRYDELQRICKARRKNRGLISGSEKKIMLLSATPLNNRPEDLENLILLFQNSHQSTIEGVDNLQSFFAPLKKRYKDAMKNRKNGVKTDDAENIYNEIRTRVLDKITVRRTRGNIENDPTYNNEIKFPKVLAPTELEYRMDTELEALFYSTINLLTNNDTGISYARYRAIEFLNDKKLPKHFNRAKNISRNLKEIYRVHMVKRLESSFYAFKRSLDTFLQITEGMINMFNEDKIIIAPEINVKDKQAKGWELDKIIEFAIRKGFDKEDVEFHCADFNDKFLNMLYDDKEKIEWLINKWGKIEQDPKLQLFIEKLNGELFDKEKNPTGKLVIFSESVDTVKYLEQKLINNLGRNDILGVSSDNVGKWREIIENNFDANIESEKQKSDYNIIITSDVLSEGVNLHRANVIVNYDSPWNATRLMQRIGRVNRIGSVAGAIYNYMFYPSAQGNKEIHLYENALIKLQGFHSALGEDAQIYSKEEILHDFKLYDPDVKDKQDELQALLEEVRTLYETDRTLYHKIKELPLKSRTARHKTEELLPQTVVFISARKKVEYYQITDNNVKTIEFIDAAKILKAKKEELPADLSKIENEHYTDVKKALCKFNADRVTQQDTNSIGKNKTDNTYLKAMKFLREYNTISQDDVVKQKIAILKQVLERGEYNKLPKEIKKLSTLFQDMDEIKHSQYSIDILLNELYETYGNEESERDNIDNSTPNIIISETIY